MDYKTKTWKFWNNMMNLSINKTHDCLNEWERIFKHEFDDLNEEVNDNEEIECICSQKHIVKIFYFKNRLNDNVIRIGSKCIKQFLHQHYDQIKEERQKLMEDKKEINKLINKRCERCLSNINLNNKIYTSKDRHTKESYEHCGRCTFINNYALNKLEKGYIKWLRQLEKTKTIIEDTILDRQIKFLNILKLNRQEIKDLEKKHLDLVNNLENNYTF
jgi:hypothetical protein